jgi:archaetidylinositol phosphate synthase
VANAHPIPFGRVADIGARDAGVEFRSPNRIQTNVLAGWERAVLQRICRGLPSWVTPDQLTAVGVAGAAICSLGYIGSNWRPEFLLLASLGLVVNWFGDSLDGSLARHRKIERPRYGYFLDHSLDAFSLLIIALGLGLSPYVSMNAALFLLAGYYLLTIHVLISSHVLRELALTHVYCGPTELRLLTILFNSVVFAFGPLYITLLGAMVSVYSLLVGLEGALFMTIVMFDARRTVAKLNQTDRGERAPSQVQRSKLRMNSSIAAKKDDHPGAT